MICASFTISASAFATPKNHYELFELPMTATAAQIKARYRKLAKMYHPDIHPGAEDKIVQLNLAYEVLSDPEKRGAYDFILKHPEKVAAAKAVSEEVAIQNQILDFEKRGFTWEEKYQKILYSPDPELFKKYASTRNMLRSWATLFGPSGPGEWNGIPTKSFGKFYDWIIVKPALEMEERLKSYAANPKSSWDEKIKLALSEEKDIMHMPKPMNTLVNWMAQFESAEQYAKETGGAQSAFKNLQKFCLKYAQVDDFKLLPYAGLVDLLYTSSEFTRDPFFARNNKFYKHLEGRTDLADIIRDYWKAVLSDLGKNDSGIDAANVKKFTSLLFVPKYFISSKQDLLRAEQDFADLPFIKDTKWISSQARLETISEMSTFYAPLNKWWPNKLLEIATDLDSSVALDVPKLAIEKLRIQELAAARNAPIIIKTGEKVIAKKTILDQAIQTLLEAAPDSSRAQAILDHLAALSKDGSLAERIKSLAAQTQTPSPPKECKTLYSF